MPKLTIYHIRNGRQSVTGCGRSISRTVKLIGNRRAWFAAEANNQVCLSCKKNKAAFSRLPD